MEVIFNGKLLAEKDVRLNPQNRAFAYGDGIFETMIVRRGTCALLHYHFQRLLKGAEVLQMEPAFSEQALESYIWQLAAKSPQPLQRMRLQLWRTEGGLYTPEQHQSEFLLTSSGFEKPAWVKAHVGFSKQVQLSFSSFSGLKSMNALPYVLAGLEKKERRLDDLILTDQHGHVAECCAANLFWLQDNSWYTPSLESGCIAGVMRAYLLDQMYELGIPVKETLLPKEKLREAEALLACNVTGIYSILQLDKYAFKDGRDKLTRLIQLPEL